MTFGDDTNLIPGVINKPSEINRPGELAVMYTQRIESWTLKQDITNQLDAFEIWTLRFENMLDGQNIEK